MIQKLLWDTQIIWMIFIKILKSTIQVKNKKNSIVFGVIIAEVHNNEKLSKIVTELFIRGIKLNISFAFSSHNHVLKDQKILV